MDLFKTSRYQIRKKPSNELEFEEASPFYNKVGEKMLGHNDQVAYYAKTAMILIFFLTVILCVQVFELQIINANNYSTLAENNRVKEITFRADRGIIYDKDKNILVRNKAIFDLVAAPKDITTDSSELKKIAAQISSLTKREQADIETTLNNLDRKSDKQQLVAENLDVANAIALQSISEKIIGFEVKNNAIREYVDAKYFSNIIGYTGRVSKNDIDSDLFYEATDYIGRGGLESFYENYLRGERGMEKVEVDAHGKSISTIDKVEAKTGENLILSIDGALQKKLYDSLSEMAKKIKVKEKNTGAAAAVAMDPRTGEILALVSLPSYDNNIFVDPANKNKISAIFQDPLSPMYNRVISGTYPPGSTAKPVMGIAALSEGIITKNTTINDKGVISVYSQNFFGWNRAGLGPMNIYSALAQSSDIYFYTIGGGYGDFNGLGIDRIDEYLWKFNLGKKLGIDLPNESGGFVPTKEWKMANIGEPWTIGNTYHVSIGQGYLLVTPLQVASWTSFFANGGTLYKPHLVDKIISGDKGETVKNIEPEIINNAIADKKYIDIVRDGMRQVITKGSGASLNDLAVKVAGKTGTAQYGLEGKAHAWFTAFAPYDDPQIVLTVLIEGGGEGGINSVPVAKDILSWYFKSKD